MAQAKLLFTWEIESFNEIAEQPNLLRLRREFGMRQYSLSGSLLIWENRGVIESWVLADFKGEKIYHIGRNDAEMEVSEAFCWDPEYLRSRFDHRSYGTDEGFIDWLKLFNLAESDLEDLKRTDLSGRKLDLEMGHAPLLATYKRLQKVLASPREWLIGLSRNDIQQIRGCLRSWYEIGNAIWAIDPSTSKERHAKVLQQIFCFSDEVKQQLGQVEIYLQSKKSEQLESQVNTTRNTEKTVLDLKDYAPVERSLQDNGMNTLKADSLLQLELHPVIARKVLPIFEKELYGSAVFEAFKHVEIAVRKAGDYTDKDIGTTLMRNAFHVDTGNLTDQDQHDGEKQARSDLFAGAIGSYKNPGSHRDVEITAQEATEVIIVASHLLRIVDSCNQSGL